jgi:hypothetical protein
MATYRFMTGTWYEIDLPDDKVDIEGYFPEDLYEAYFDDNLPEDVQVYEVEADHIWEN